MIKVSIVIPVYNAEQYIERCIRSILSQSLQEFEIICVVDCSPDNSSIIIKEIASNDERVRILENEVNCGPMYSRMIGYKNAKGEYISFVDSDDTIEKTFLETLYKKAKDSNADIASCNYKYVRSDCSERPFISHLRYGNNREAVFRSLLSYEYEHILCNKLFKSSLLHDNSYEIYKNVKRGEDACFFYQIADNSRHTVHVDAILYNYLENPMSSSHKSLSDDDITSMMKTLKIMETICKKYTSLNDILFKRINFSICALYAQGYGSNPNLMKAIKENGLEDYINIFNMFNKLDFSYFIKINIKRYLFPVFGVKFDG